MTTLDSTIPPILDQHIGLWKGCEPSVPGAPHERFQLGEGGWPVRDPMESFRTQWAGVFSPSHATCPNRTTRREQMRSEMCGRPVLSVIIVFLILSCHLTPKIRRGQRI